MLRLLSIFALLFLAAQLPAQTVTGTITSSRTGEPLPYASIYVQETGSGTVSNENGRYQLKLGGGSYTLVFQYLGYATEVRSVSGQRQLDIALNDEALNLETIEVVDGGEDVSYSVIRRAIAKADYHLNQVDHYTARVYIKGTGKVNKVSKLILAMVPKEDRDEIDTSRVFTSESLSNITYTRPNTFKQDVISTYQIGDLPADPTPYLFASFYEPEIAEAMSPLSPKAFSYYRFEHQGVFADRGRLVNKIKVIPRSRGEDVFSGYLNIVQDEWAIHSLELEVYKFGFRFLIKQTYAPVETQVWMPVSTTVDIDGQIFGIALEGHYISTVSDYVVRLNPDLPGYVEVIDEKTAPENAAEVKRANRSRSYEQRLAEGGELTRKELRQLMRDYEKEERKTAEEPQVESNYSFNQDSSKGVRDTAFWAQVRPVPLTRLETRSYAIEDSIARFDTLKVSQNEDEDGRTVSVNIGEDGTSVTTSGYRNQISIWPQLDFFNAVEGYAAGVELKRNFKVAKGHGLQLSLAPRYGFGWKRATLEGALAYVKRTKGQHTKLRLSGGRALRQFDPAEAIDPFLNTVTMLFSHDNYLSLYERAYGRLDVERKLSDRVTLSGAMSYEDRRRVSNVTNQGWFNRKDGEYRPNQPFNAELAGDEFREDLPLFAAALLEFGVAFRPGLKYRINNGRKEEIANSAPLVTLKYFSGLPEIGEATAGFQHLQAAYRHRFALGVRGKVDVLLRGGAFVNDEFVQLPDFQHFATSELFYTDADPIGSYRLLPYYALSTSQEYLEFYGHYQFRKFLFSRIWNLQKAGIREDLFVNYLYTPDSQHYTELGYTIDNIFRVLRLEFVTSFQDFKYRDFGVRLSIASVFGRNDN